MNPAITELLAADRPSFSFEFFPPRTEQDEAVLWQAIRELEPLNPSFVDVTYGAGGSRRDLTLRTVERVLAETDLTVVAHLTCVGASREELTGVIRRFAAAGVRNILALRGDPPGGPGTEWEAPPDGLTRAEQLVRLLHDTGDFCVGVAAYPRRHRESVDDATEVQWFVQKTRAGADFAITQFFYDSSDYFRFVKAVREAGCDLPILPGVMPVTRITQIERFPQLSGVPFPPDLAARLRAVGDERRAVEAIGIDVATDLCRELLAGGAPGIHFYTLNRSTATREIHRRLTA
jgi:methylenetetrahydrofolate reductase (NADPH)